jgi:hypothetical protein
VNPVPDPLLLRKSGSAGNRTRASESAARNSDHYTTEEVSKRRSHFKIQKRTCSEQIYDHALTKEFDTKNECTEGQQQITAVLKSHLFYCFILGF